MNRSKAEKAIQHAVWYLGMTCLFYGGGTGDREAMKILCKARRFLLREQINK